MMAKVVAEREGAAVVPEPVAAAALGAIPAPMPLPLVMAVLALFSAAEAAGAVTTTMWMVAAILNRQLTYVAATAATG